MEEAELDRSEQATPFKLKRARERGAVARSLDLGFFAALAALIAFLWAEGAHLALAVAEGAREALVIAPSLAASPATLIEVIAKVAAPAVSPLMAFIAVLFGLALVFEFVQVGPVFSAHPLKPDFSRINPAKGLKRIFSWQMLIQAFKAVVKLSVYSAIAWLVVQRALLENSYAIADGSHLAAAMLAVARRLLIFFAIAALAFAALDQVFVRRDFAKRMRMSRREIKREHKDREGDPRLKQKRRQVHSEFAKAVKALRDVRGADVVIVNPTHYAVALKYDSATMQAPRVLARGAGEMARRIKRVGFIYGVIAISDPALARALFRAGRIGGEIPQQFYQPVAELYRKYRIGKKLAAGNVRQDKDQGVART